MRIQSTHSLAARGLDAYFTPPEATHALLRLERERIPRLVWDPAAGDGAIISILREQGYNAVASDIADYGCPGCVSDMDYLTQPAWIPEHGVITNPPFRLALAFAEKAVGEACFVAFLLRTNFLEGVLRLAFFRKRPPSRIWISSRRLPMMHRHGWTGPRSTSNTCYAWFVWDRAAPAGSVVNWFDWKERVL